MPLTRNSKQSSETLAQFYSDSRRNDPTSPLNVAMRAFVEMVNETFVETEIFGTTSHFHLLLQRDDGAANRYVDVVGSGNYSIVYKIAGKLKFMDEESTTLLASNLEEARKYLIIAMTESEGWTGNRELKNLYETLSL